ncbi:DDE-type integrase/transposase/recombinase [Methyloterricola oryzae]|uniref:DDE-type integrase/transposase/recombinase n=1 Tax=Methyloterricola oryzae TaxID=1495050 RepID=UPI0011AF8769
MDVSSKAAHPKFKCPDLPVGLINKAGLPISFLLTAHRDKDAAQRFLRKAVGHHELPEKITIDIKKGQVIMVMTYRESGLPEN